VIRRLASALAFFISLNFCATPAPADQGYRLTAYAWNADSVLDAASAPDYWDTLFSQHISRLLLSFNGAQLRALVPGGLLRPRLDTFLQQAASHGVEVNALLGEPSWILPEHRSELVAIVTSLRDIAFSGIELDMEPNQLNEPGLTAQGGLKQMVASAAAAAHAATVPVGVSVNLKYLEMPMSPCLPCALQSAGVTHVTIMAYITNPDRVAWRVIPVISANPDVSFSIAQSVEPELSSSESYAKDTRTEFLSSMARLSFLVNRRNFSGVVVQSYDDYVKLAFPGQSQPVLR
jgi:hypothetical protein